jgi:hypothetical protein
MNRLSFNIYDIGYEGDETKAIFKLQKIGATEIQIIARDYDDEGAIRVSCQMPDSIRDLGDLERLTDLIF